MSVLHGIFDAPTALGTSIQTKDRRCEAACQSLECVLDCISMRKSIGNRHAVGSWYDSTSSSYDQAKDWLWGNDDDDGPPGEDKPPIDWTPTTTIEPETGTSFPNTSTESYNKGQELSTACNSSYFIKAVQAKIGAEPDGVWGPKSQAALNATGKKFQDFVYCTPPVPSASAGTSTGGGTSTHTGGGTSTSQLPLPAPAPSAERQAGMTGGIMDTFKQDFMGIPVGVWGVGIAVVTAVTIAVGKQKNWW